MFVFGDVGVRAVGSVGVPAGGAQAQSVGTSEELDFDKDSNLESSF